MSDTELDPADPEGAIAAAARRCSNWGRRGEDDVLGTLNHLDDGKRLEGAQLVRRGVSFSLSQSLDMNGPQKGWRRRTNPVHTMLDTRTDAERGTQGFPHGLGGADDLDPLAADCAADGVWEFLPDSCSAARDRRRRRPGQPHRRQVMGSTKESCQCPL